MADTRRFPDLYHRYVPTLYESPTRVVTKTFATTPGSTWQYCRWVDGPAKFMPRAQGLEVEHDARLRLPPDVTLNPSQRAEAADRVKIVRKHGDDCSYMYTVVYVKDNHGKHQVAFLKEL